MGSCLVCVSVEIQVTYPCKTHSAGFGYLKLLMGQFGQLIPMKVINVGIIYVSHYSWQVFFCFLEVVYLLIFFGADIKKVLLFIFEIDCSNNILHFLFRGC